MNFLKNKKGSALLCCVLLIIILTILLSSVLTAVYAYYTHTMNTVKRQQAYFTARSAVGVVLEELTNETEDANGVVTYSPLVPAKKGAKNAVTISDFGFGENMGVAEAKIVRTEDEEVSIEVTAYYPDNINGEKYVMHATAVRQPLYFGGIAVKHLTLNGNLTLGENTDFYWNNTDLFNTAGNGSSFVNNVGGKLTINGNLVTKKNATITSGTTVAGREFYGTASFVAGNHSKKIWSPTEYIISNKTLRVDDKDSTEYTTNAINTLKNITNYTIKYCNSRGTETSFGPATLAEDMLGFSISSAMSNIPALGPVFSDMQSSLLNVSDSNNSALSIRYIKILSTGMTINNALEDAKKNVGIIGNALLSAIQSASSQLFRTALDVPYIDFTSTDEGNRSDEVVPLTYLFVDGGEATGLKVRVRFGTDPGKYSTIGQFADNISNNVGSFFNQIFDIHKKPSYIVAYLEKNGRIELGYPKNMSSAEQAKRTPQNLIFLYSIYGGDNTTVVIHDGVTVVGEIICDNLICEGNAKVVYSSVNGGQIAKQKIAEYWAVANYSD